MKKSHMDFFSRFRKSEGAGNNILAIRKDIPEDNITLIPEPPKTETPSVDAPKRKKVNPPTDK